MLVDTTSVVVYTNSMSDELISTYDIRGTEATGLTVECAWNVGKALAEWLPTSGRVLVAGRVDHQTLIDAATEGLRLQGRDVTLGGELGKEQIADLVTSQQLSGAVLIGHDALTDEHTIELYQHEGRLVTSETGLQSIRELIDAGNFVPAAVKGELTSIA